MSNFLYSCLVAATLLFTLGPTAAFADWKEVESSAFDKDSEQLSFSAKETAPKKKAAKRKKAARKKAARRKGARKKAGKKRPAKRRFAGKKAAQRKGRKGVAAKRRKGRGKWAKKRKPVKKNRKAPARRVAGKGKTAGKKSAPGKKAPLGAAPAGAVATNAPNGGGPTAPTSPNTDAQGAPAGTAVDPATGLPVPPLSQIDDELAQLQDEKAEEEDDEEEPRPPVNIVVDVRAHSESPMWLAEGLEQTLEKELAKHEKLDVVKPPAEDKQRCDNDEPCDLSRLQDQGVSLLLLATAEPEAMNWALYETWTPGLVKRGTIEIGPGTELVTVRREALQAFAPLLKPGGLVDRAPRLDQPDLLAEEPEALPPTPIAEGVIIVLGLAALWLSLPLIGAAALVRRSRRRLMRSVPLWGCLLGTIGLFALAVYTHTNALDAGEWVAVATSATAMGWAPGLRAGLCWGWLAWDASSFVVQPVRGLHRAEHAHMIHIIKLWALASLQRLAMLLVYAIPAALLAGSIIELVELPASGIVLIVLPAYALLVRMSWSAWVHVFGPYLDDRLVLGTADSANPWHREIHDYVMGYIRRTGSPVDSKLLNNVLFLPARGVDGVRSYGGAGTPSRIVINSKLLRKTLGDVREPLAQPSDIFQPHWGAAPVGPGAQLEDEEEEEQKSGSVSMRGLKAKLVKLVNSAEDGPSLKGRLAKLWRGSEEKDVPSGTTFVQGPSNAQPLGLNATLLGVVAPLPSSDTAPLISDDPADLLVVRDLLAEQGGWTAPDPDDEHDESDPNDMDMMFGALSRELAAVDRRDEQRGSFALAAENVGRPVNELTAFDSGTPPAALARRMRVWGAFLSRSDKLADAHSVLTDAHHHLLQYLYFMNAGSSADEALLTTRATKEELQKNSREILRKLPPASETPTPVMLRLRSLAILWSPPLRTPRTRMIRIASVVAVVAVVGVFATNSIQEAIAYHPTYVQRLAEQAADANPAEGDPQDPAQGVPQDSTQGDPQSDQTEANDQRSQDNVQ